MICPLGELKGSMSDYRKEFKSITHLNGYNTIKNSWLHVFYNFNGTVVVSNSNCTLVKKCFSNKNQTNLHFVQKVGAASAAIREEKNATMSQITLYS